jgi:tetratricopeptide (TPR) repeat protein
VDHAETSNDPEILLAEENRFYWPNNGQKAAPLYEKAESLFRKRDDARNELHAKIGRLRSEAETMSFVDLSRFLGDQLNTTVVRNDPELRLWCLTAKAYTDIEIDYQAEKRDWLEAREIAKSLSKDHCNEGQGRTGSGLPFMGYEGKSAALVALGRPEEAKRVLEGALAKAKPQQELGQSAQLLIVLGKLAAQQRNEREAIADLEEAGRLATQVRFYRMEADAMFELAKLYRDLGDVATSNARATAGLVASQRVGDRYFPRNLTVLADLEARRGHIIEAKQLYEQAEDVIDGMLGGDDSYWNSSIVAAMSQTYLQHFELLAKQGDTAGAFQVLERVRGRTPVAFDWVVVDATAMLPVADATSLSRLSDGVLVVIREGHTRRKVLNKALATKRATSDESDRVKVATA